MGCVNSVGPAPAPDNNAVSPGVLMVEDGHMVDESGLQFREAATQDLTSKLMAATKRKTYQTHRLSHL